MLLLTHQVLLVVVDSVTFHFRQDWPDLGLRARVLSGMAQEAMQLAETRRIAMVFMNQVIEALIMCQRLFLCVRLIYFLSVLCGDDALLILVHSGPS